MPAPQVSWWNPSNDTAIPKWEIGVIDAGSKSPEFGVLIWNNRWDGVATQTDLSTMTNCTITTKDETGGDTGEIITNTWIEVRVDSMGEAAFTKIGGTVKKTIQAGGTTTNVDGSFAPNGKEIMGVKNDGTVGNSGANFCQVALRANVPATATAGNVNFLTRVAYQYI